MTEAAIEALLTWFSRDELRAMLIEIHRDKIVECNEYLKQLRGNNEKAPSRTD